VTTAYLLGRGARLPDPQVSRARLRSLVRGSLFVRHRALVLDGAVWEQSQGKEIPPTIDQGWLRRANPWTLAGSPPTSRERPFTSASASFYGNRGAAERERQFLERFASPRVRRLEERVRLQRAIAVLASVYGPVWRPSGDS
jgi:hypothetical protein